MMLTRDKDVDLYEILMNLDDESLLNFCKSAVKQEYEKSLCADETFWKLRTKNYYPLAYEIKKDDLKWKKYYLKIVYYKDKMEREYGFGFTDGDVEKFHRLSKEFYYIAEKMPKNVIFELLLQMNPEDIRFLCSSQNSKIRNICQSSYFKNSYIEKWP